tara:strand:- start:1790 stop:1930 length:141 start_codon:yes stop_codon:yes gene_type:complete
MAGEHDSCFQICPECGAVTWGSELPDSCRQKEDSDKSKVKEAKDDD